MKRLILLADFLSIKNKKLQPEISLEKKVIVSGFFYQQSGVSFCNNEL